MDCINILDVKRAINKLLNEYESNNRKERCSEILIKNSDKRIYPTALRVTLTPNIEDDANSVIIDVVYLVLNDLKEPKFKRHTIGTTISELCVNCEDEHKLERWLCNGKSDGFVFPERELIIKDAVVNLFSREDVISAFDNVDEFYQMLSNEEYEESDTESFELSADDMQSLVDDIANELTK